MLSHPTYHAIFFPNTNHVRIDPSCPALPQDDEQDGDAKTEAKKDTSASSTELKSPKWMVVGFKVRACSLAPGATPDECNSGDLSRAMKLEDQQ